MLVKPKEVLPLAPAPNFQCNRKPSDSSAINVTRAPQLSKPSCKQQNSEEKSKENDLALDCAQTEEKSSQLQSSPIFSNDMEIGIPMSCLSNTLGGFQMSNLMPNDGSVSDVTDLLLPFTSR